MAEKIPINPHGWGPALAAAVAGILLALMGVISAELYRKARIGIPQPIPFSHRVHVTDKRISCFICHPLAQKTARAGIPPLETCLHCHSKIIVNYPPIRQMRRQFGENRPVVWKRVNWVPEFVYFNHSVHVHQGIDCGICHGNVAQMDRVVAAQEFRMGFCVQCHRDYDATHDCFTCHR